MQRGREKEEGLLDGWLVGWLVWPIAIIVQPLNNLLFFCQPLALLDYLSRPRARCAPIWITIINESARVHFTRRWQDGMVPCLNLRQIKEITHTVQEITIEN